MILFPEKNIKGVCVNKEKTQLLIAFSDGGHAIFQLNLLSQTRDHSSFDNIELVRLGVLSPDRLIDEIKLLKSNIQDNLVRERDLVKQVQVATEEAHKKYADLGYIVIEGAKKCLS